MGVSIFDVHRKMCSVCVSECICTNLQSVIQPNDTYNTMNRAMNAQTKKMGAASKCVIQSEGVFSLFVCFVVCARATPTGKKGGKFMYVLAFLVDLIYLFILFLFIFEAVFLVSYLEFELKGKIGSLTH